MADQGIGYAAQRKPRDATAPVRADYNQVDMMAPRVTLEDIVNGPNVQVDLDVSFRLGPALSSQ